MNQLIWKSRTGHEFRHGPALAGIRLSAEQEADAILGEAARVLAFRGLRVAGLIQEALPERDGSCRPALFVRDLFDGARTRISEDRGPEARGCRLDREALTRAVMRVDARLRQGAEILLVNRFGKAETEGGGFRGPIERCVELGVPVVAGIRTSYLDAWERFHGGLATPLPPDPQAVVEWAVAAAFHAPVRPPWNG